MGREKYTLVKEQAVYTNKWVTFFDDVVQMPDGRKGTYIRLRYHDNPMGVVVIPRLNDGRVLILKVQRYAVGKALLEFPRGGGERNESAKKAALRELQEETGIVASKTRLLGHMYPDAAIVMTRVAVILADLPPEAETTFRLAGTEGIVSGKFVEAELLDAMVSNGKISDGFTLGALALYKAKIG